jgi:hypothetical protein
MLRDPDYLPCKTTYDDKRERDMDTEETPIPTAELQGLPQYDSDGTHQKPQAIGSAGSEDQEAQLEQSEAESGPAANLVQRDGGVVSGEKTAGECSLGYNRQNLQKRDADQGCMETG